MFVENTPRAFNHISLYMLFISDSCVNEEGTTNTKGRNFMTSSTHSSNSKFKPVMLRVNVCILRVESFFNLKLEVSFIEIEFYIVIEKNVFKKTLLATHFLMGHLKIIIRREYKIFPFFKFVPTQMGH